MTAPGTSEQVVRDGVEQIGLTVNGERRLGSAEPRMLLSDFLRHELGLTGTHVGCEQGVCGACTILLDGELARSCLLFAVQVEGSEIETIESLGTSEPLHPIQAAFRSEHGLQCGFCTPAMVLAAKRLLDEDHDPSEQTIREHLSSQICRCTGYVGIVAAVRKAARELSAPGGKE